MICVPRIRNFLLLLIIKIINFYFVPISFIQDIMECFILVMFYKLIKAGLLSVRITTYCMMKIKIQTYTLPSIQTYVLL